MFINTHTNNSVLFLNREALGKQASFKTNYKKAKITLDQTRPSLENLKANFVTFLGRKEIQFESFNRSDITFDNTGGFHSEKAILKNILKTALSSNRPDETEHTYLLQGNSGNGKSILIKALAGEINKNNIPSIRSYGGKYGIDKTRELRGDYNGDGGERVANLFWYARNKARESPSKSAVIFIENIDAMLPVRSCQNQGEISINASQTLANFLAELENIKSDKELKIFVVATSSNSLSIDKSAFDQFNNVINVYIPKNKEERKEIIQAIIKNNNIQLDLASSDEIIDRIAHCTGGYNPLRIKNIFNIAQKYAESQDNPIQLKDALAGFLDERDGKIKPISDNIDFIRVSIAHEIGHALTRYIMSRVANKLASEHDIKWSECGLINCINLDPRDGYSASVEVMYNYNNPFNSYEYNFAEMVSNYASQPCEALYNLTTNGPKGDIIKSYELARKAVKEWGMGKNSGMQIPGIDNPITKWEDAIEEDIDLITSSAITASKKIVDTYKDFIMMKASDYALEMQNRAENRNNDTSAYPVPLIITDKEFIEGLKSWESTIDSKKIQTLEQDLIELILKSRPSHHVQLKKQLVS